MPELPEVENVRRSLASLVSGKDISRVSVRLPRIVRQPDDLRQFEQNLMGRRIEGVSRRGKYLLFDIPPYTLVSHLRMEGQYSLAASESEPMLPHTHVLFDLTDGTQLRYRDVRQFGTMDLVLKTNPLPAGVLALGPEPFDESLTGAHFHGLLTRRHAPIKAVLLNQSILAGLGNIYVDEALFSARLHPQQVASDVSRQKADMLLTAIQEVLERAIEAGGTSIKSFVDGYGRHGGFQIELAVYGRDGQPCRRCGSTIQKTRVAGRGTHLCPACQKLRKRRKVRATPSDGARASTKDGKRIVQ